MYVSPRTTKIRQNREKRGGRREKKKRKVQKDRLENTIPLRTKQILTQSSHRQHGRAGRSPSKATNRVEITEERQSLTSFPC